jgi:hypothetical protein
MVIDPNLTVASAVLSPLSEHEREQLADALAKLYVTTADGRPRANDTAVRNAESPGEIAN